jgi:hypothetical protein
MSDPFEPKFVGTFAEFDDYIHSLRCIRADGTTEHDPVAARNVADRVMERIVAAICDQALR